MPVPSCHPPDASAAATQNSNAQAIACKQAGTIASMTSHLSSSGICTQSIYGLHAVHGKDPVDLLTCPDVQAAPSAMPSMMGGHGMVYVPGVVSCLLYHVWLLARTPSLSATMSTHGNQSASGKQAASNDYAASMPTTQLWGNPRLIFTRAPTMLLDSTTPQCLILALRSRHMQPAQQ